MRRWVVLAMLVGVMSSAACGAEVPPVPAHTSLAEGPALVTDTCTARNIGAFYGLAVQGPDTPDPTAIPSGFTPTSVVTCEPDWAGGTADRTAAWVETQRQGNLDTVLRAYAEPSEPRDPSCHADQVLPPTVWLVNDQGKGMRPVLPQTECGAYKRDAITAIEQLPVTTRTVQQVPFAP